MTAPDSDFLAKTDLEVIQHYHDLLGLLIETSGEERIRLWHDQIIPYHDELVRRLPTAPPPTTE